MVKLKLALELNYDIAQPGCDFIFNIHAAHTQCQVIAEENLIHNQSFASDLYRDPWTGNRYLRVAAMAGPFKIQYNATVVLAHHMVPPDQLMEVPIARLPGSVLRYLYPSRYCQSDRLHKLAIREFGHLWQGYSRVQAIQEWVQRHVSFNSGASNASTSAIDTLIDQGGVCRDFSHLMIALCRAVNIPARFATGIDYGASVDLGPTDFHAYVEVFLGDRWYIFDPSGLAVPMGFVRFGTGRDAADTAFATMFGSMYSTSPLISIEAIMDGGPECQLPYLCAEALSTDSDV
jgi:transglutaminase-like putative cysteine protease